MNTEEIRIAVAELDGWMIRHKPIGKHCCETGVDNFTTSHDAIIPAVSRWCGEDVARRTAFSNALHEVSGRREGTPKGFGGRPMVSDFHKFTGPAIEWCEALLKAAKVWKEGK